MARGAAAKLVAGRARRSDRMAPASLHDRHCHRAMTDLPHGPSGTPKILAFDCAGGACSAALLANGELVAQRFAPMLQGHGERLMPMLREVMAEARLAFAALDAIAVTVGPGRFTGLRVGIEIGRAHV